jgi:hypothetical protein
MGDCIVLRKAVYRMPGTNRPVWAVVVAEAQSEPLSLLLVKTQHEDRPHMLALGIETSAGHYESAGCNHLAISTPELAALGGKLQALAENLANEEFRRQFRHDEDWLAD